MGGQGPGALGPEEAPTIEELLYKAYLWSLADKPVVVDLNGYWSLKNLLAVTLARLHAILKGRQPLYQTFTEAYINQDPNPTGKILAVSTNDLERIKSLWGKHLEVILESPASYVNSLADALHISQLSYIILESTETLDEIVKVGNGSWNFTARAILGGHAITLAQQDEAKLKQETLEILDYAGIAPPAGGQATTSPQPPDIAVAEALRRLRDAQEEALKDEVVAGTIRLHVTEEGAVAEGPEHYTTKALTIKCLVERMRREGLQAGRLLEEARDRILVENPHILPPAIPDITYKADDGLEVYEVETLAGATLDPPLYLYEKYLKAKRLWDALRNTTETVKKITIILPNQAVLPLYPRKLRERLARTARELTEEYGVEVTIAAIDINLWQAKRLT